MSQIEYNKPYTLAEAAEIAKLRKSVPIDAFTPFVKSVEFHLWLGTKTISCQIITNDGTPIHGHAHPTRDEKYDEATGLNYSLGCALSAAASAYAGRITQNLTNLNWYTEPL